MRLTCGSPEKRYIMEALCGGVAFLDFDNDGWLDILLVNGSTLEEMKRPTPGLCAKDGIRLYRNRRDGTFADVSAKAGLVRAAEEAATILTAGSRSPIRRRSPCSGFKYAAHLWQS